MIAETRDYGGALHTLLDARADLYDRALETFFFSRISFHPEQVRSFMFIQSQPHPETIKVVEALAGLGKYLLDTINNESLELNLHGTA